MIEKIFTLRIMVGMFWIRNMILAVHNPDVWNVLIKDNI